MYNRILIYDSYQIVQIGLIKIINEHLPKYSIDSAYNESEYENLINENMYDLIIIDVMMPKINVKNLLALSKKYNFLVFSEINDNVFGLNLIEQGSKGVLNKDANDKEIIYAIQKVIAGEYFIPHNLTQFIAKNISISNNKISPYSKLSNREKDILRFLLKGLGNLEISNILNIHPSTTGTHKSRILSKLGARNIIELNEIVNLDSSFYD